MIRLFSLRSHSVEKWKVWIDEWMREGTLKLKGVLVPPPILSRLIEGLSLYLYLSITNQAMNSLLIQEMEKIEQLLYFVSKVFKGIEAWYQKIESFDLAVVVTVKKLMPYFHGHQGATALWFKRCSLPLLTRWVRPTRLKFPMPLVVWRL